MAHAREQVQFPQGSNGKDLDAASEDDLGNPGGVWSDDDDDDESDTDMDSHGPDTTKKRKIASGADDSVRAVAATSLNGVPRAPASSSSAASNGHSNDAASAGAVGGGELGVGGIGGGAVGGIGGGGAREGVGGMWVNRPRLAIYGPPG